MYKKVLCILLAVFAGSLLFAGKPEITNSGTFYIYSFFWQNADFTQGTDDGDQFFYMHADVGINADFGSGISTQVTVGGWGTFGKHPITGEGNQGGTPGENVAVREAYIDLAKLFDSPLSFRAGKMHVLYPGQVFDGGEDGAMGAKFYGMTEMFDFDLAWYRLVENGGCWCAGMGPVEDDLDLFAAYFTAKFIEGAFRLSPYWFWRTQSMTAYDTLEQPYEVKDDPMWIGGRLDVGPIAGLSLNGEFTMMMGQNDIAGTAIDYAGMHYMGKLSYAFPTLPFVLGGGYYVFTGDDGDTDTENELYESPIWGPYTNDFYKWWPGFGPALTMRSAYGFALMSPIIIPGTTEEMYTANIAVINGNIGFHQGPFMLRGDFFKYTKNWVAAGAEDDMGMEIALLTTYTYKKTVTVGATGGYWIPGEYFGADLDPMLGGYLFAYLSF